MNEIVPKEWRPDRPVSKGASAYHDAVVNAPYYTWNLDRLMEIVKSHVKDNEIIVDFGAGTGVSAIRLLSRIKADVELWLVDNSPAWLGKAYEVLGSTPNVKFFLLEKEGDRYLTLAETVGFGVVDHVVCANTIHLIPNLADAFKGISAALKSNGRFFLQSGNIIRKDRQKGALMFDDTIKRVHDIALEIVKRDERFAKYMQGLGARIRLESEQRRFVFPDPRPLEEYLQALENSGFSFDEPQCRFVKIDYSDWIEFLRVKRLQAGVLPEIGGKDPSPEEEHDRDELIRLAAGELFEELKSQNPLADEKGFIVESIYVSALKKDSNGLSFREVNMAKKVALVTGASKGIGKAIALELAASGMNVVVNYNKDEKEAMAVVEQVKRIGAGCIAVKADVSKFEDCAAMAAEIRKEFGCVNVLVNNAGALADKSFKNMTKEQWDFVIKTNLDSVFNVTKNVLEIMPNSGRIINISSIVALNGNFGQTNYGASKAGIIGFTKSLAKEVGKKGITVNAVAPGFIDTQMTKSIPFLRRKIMAAMIPMKRIGTPEDVAHAVGFLASDKAGYITGEVLCVDGGFSF